jgi:hypothetical protein
MRGQEAASLRAGDIEIFSKRGRTCESYIAEIHVHLRNSKTDTHGSGVTQVVALGEEQIFGDIREVLPWVRERVLVGKAQWLFPFMPSTYRSQMRDIIKQIGADTPDLLYPLTVNPDDYGLHSWRKTGATIAAASGLNDFEIMQIGRGKSLEFTKYARVAATAAAERMRDAILRREFDRVVL